MSGSIGASDETLLEAARNGDALAIESLLDRHQDRIFAFGIKMCGDREDAKEVLQETLLAAARGVGTFRGASSLSTWLYTIARSFCIKQRRKRLGPAQREPLGVAEQERMPAQTRDPEGTLENSQLKQTLNAAIAELEPASREVLLLRDMEGLSAAEVAEVTGLSVDAVKSRLHRARVAVRARLAPQLGVTAIASSKSCPDILLQFSKHLEGDIDAATCATMEAHVRGCPNCSATCDSLKQTLSLCRDSTGPKVPDTVAHAVREAVRASLAAR